MLMSVLTEGRYDYSAKLIQTVCPSSYPSSSPAFVRRSKCCLAMESTVSRWVLPRMEVVSEVSSY